MANVISGAIKGIFWTSLTAIFALTAGPSIYEMAHNNRTENKAGASIDQIVQNSFFVSDMTRAEPLRTSEVSDKLTAIMNTAGGEVPSWSSPVKLWKSGYKRTCNNFDGTVRFFEKIIGDVDDSYHQGSYNTLFDVTQQNLDKIAKMKISVVFDKTLSDLNAGSLYFPSEGVIVLNPALSQENLALHVQRHLDRLKQEVITPYERITMDTPSSNGSYRDMAGQIKKLDEVLSGSAMSVLDLNADAQTASFRSLDAGKYLPPLISLKDKQPEAGKKDQVPPQVKGK
jgi:hypothetical protein